MVEHEIKRLTAVYILYRNWRGVTAYRHVVPRSISFEATVHHPEAQWLLHATDLGKGSVPRSFALADIVRWIQDTGTPPPGYSL